MTSAAKISQLLLLLPSGEIRIPLDRPTTSLGSDPSCAVSLGGLDLAPFQAVIQMEDRHFEVFNLGEAGALELNGQTVEASLLRTGDQLRLGRLKAVFLTGERDRLPEESEPAKTRTARKVWSMVCFGAAILLGRRGVARAVTEALKSRSREEPVEAPAPAAAATIESMESRAHSRAHPPQISFTDELIIGIKRTPWLLLSAILHLIFLIILDLVGVIPVEKREPLPVMASMADAGDIEQEEAAELGDAEVKLEVPEDELSEPEVEDPPDIPDEPGDEANAESPGEDGDVDGPFSVGTHVGSSLGDSLRGVGDFGKGGSVKLRELTGKLRASGLDIVFVIDSTGSMGEVLQDARDRIGQMITALGQMVPSFRLGLVTYRDVGDAYVTRAVRLTPNRYQVVHFLEDITADGGGDHPEDVLAGLQVAIKNMPWSSKARRLVVLVGDAPPHQRDSSRLKSLVRYFAGKKGTLHTIYTPNESRGPMYARKSFQDLARTGHGTFVELEQDQQILTRILEVAFGAKYQKDMKTELARVLGRRNNDRTVRWIARSKPEDILRRLTRRRIPDDLVEALSARPHPEFFGTWLDLVADKKAPMGARWVASVMIRRLVGESLRLASLRELATQLRPDRSARDLRRSLKAFRELAKEAGFQVRTGSRAKAAK